jgi:molybdopterin synthase catalytic subunit
MQLVRVQTDPFDVGVEYARLTEAAGDGAGGIGCFVGVVRGQGVAALTLEHYPGMTEKSLAAIAAEASERFGLAACTLIHRVGRLVPGDPIVLVLAAAAHRAEALDATHFLIDWLKTKAPFWKRQEFADGRAEWVQPRPADEAAASRWAPAS